MTFNVLEYCRQTQTPIIFSSSREVYGDVHRFQTEEGTADFAYAESTYSASKIAGEALVYSYARCYQLPYIVFRFSNVYGRYDNDLQRMIRVIPLFTHRILRDEPITVFGGNDKVLDFTYVDDCVEGIVRGIKGLADGTVRNETINLAYGQGNTLVRVADLIGEATGKDPDVTLAPPLLGEVTRYVADIGRARGLLDWEPSVPLETGSPAASPGSPSGARRIPRKTGCSSSTAPSSRPKSRRSSSSLRGLSLPYTLAMAAPRIGVVGATGAVGTITLELLAERGYDVRAFASARSAGSRLPFGDDEILVEEATHEALAAGDVDLFLFSVGTGASRELVPIASAAGAICIDKSSAYRLVDGYPLVVPEVNADRALESLERDRIVANPNCCTIPLTCVLKPLHDVVPLKRVHVATYQSVSGAGAQRMEKLRAEPSSEHNLVMDWDWEGVESDEESKLRAETRKILELPRTRDQRHLRARARARRPLRGDLGRVRGAPVAGGCHRDPERGSERARAAAAGVPDAEGRCRWRRGSRGADSQGRGLGQRPRALPRLRQPEKGSGAERDPDRRSAARRCRRGIGSRRSSSPAHSL